MTDRVQREKQRMEEAHARGDAAEFLRARAAYQALTELEESVHAVSIHWDPMEHPRDRLGKFVDVLAKLGRAAREIRLPEGISVERRFGRYRVTQGHSGPHPVYADVKYEVRKESGSFLTKRAAATHVLGLLSGKQSRSRSRPVAEMTERLRVFQPHRVLAKAHPGHRKFR